MRPTFLLAFVALGACHVGPLQPVEPVVLEASLVGGRVEAGAIQGVGATLVNRSRSRIVHYGRAGITSVRMFRETTSEPRRADVPADTTRPVGPYWERAYHLAVAFEPGTVTTAELPLTVVEPQSRLVLAPVRFEWPRDPGTYAVSVCSSWSPSDLDGSREVCARSVRVEVR